MKHQLNSVKKFHEVYKLNYSEKPITEIGLDTIKLRFNLMDEKRIKNILKLLKIMI